MQNSVGRFLQYVHISSKLQMESVVSVLVFSELHVALGASNCFQFVSDDGKSQLPLAGSSEYDTTGSGVQDPASGGPRGPGSHDQIPPNKPPWFDQPHPVAPWGQQQVSNAVLK